MSSAAAERIRAVAVEHAQAAKGAQVVRNVAARGLQLRRDRDAVAVVLDEEEQRQPLRRRDVERRPEAVGGRGRIAAVRHRDAARTARIAEHLLPVAQRLRPPHGRRVLGADPAAHGQRARPVPARQVEHNADVAPLAHAADAHHARGQGLLDRQAEREQQRAGTIVAASASRAPVSSCPRST